MSLHSHGAGDIGDIVLPGEQLTLRFVIASVTVLGAIGWACWNSTRLM